MQAEICLGNKVLEKQNMNLKRQMCKLDALHPRVSLQFLHDERNQQHTWRCHCDSVDGRMDSLIDLVDWWELISGLMD